jgi:hypothetical protein
LERWFIVVSVVDIDAALENRGSCGSAAAVRLEGMTDVSGGARMRVFRDGGNHAASL